LMLFCVEHDGQPGQISATAIWLGVAGNQRADFSYPGYNENADWLADPRIHPTDRAQPQRDSL